MQAEKFSNQPLFSLKGMAFWLLLSTASLAIGWLFGSQYFQQQMIAKRQLEQTNLVQQKAVVDLQTQIAQVEAAASIDKASLEKVQQTLTELQQGLAKSEEELWLYRHLLPEHMENPEAAFGSNIRLSQDQNGKKVAYKLLIFQNTRKERREVKVGYLLAVKGEADSTFQVPVSDTDVGARKISFKYFHIEEGSFELPQAFKPQMLEIRIWPDDDIASSVTQTIPWQITGTEL